MLSLIIIALTTVALWFWSKRHPKDFPPGPRLPIPLLGDALTLGVDTFGGMNKLAEKYGEMVGLYIGMNRTVIINDPELIKEACAMEELRDRPFIPGIDRARGKTSTGDIPGVARSSGTTWAEQRRFTLRTLRDMGFGKVSIEDVIEEEIERMSETFDQDQGGYVKMTRKFNMPVLGTLWRLLTNERLEHDDPKLLKMGENIHRIASSPRIIIELLRIIPYDSFEKFLKMLGFGTASDVLPHLIDVANEMREGHEKSFQEDSLRDFTDTFIEKRNRSEKDTSFHGPDGTMNHTNTTVDLLLAGSETVSASLTWGILAMAKHPDMQKRVQDELDTVTGKSRSPHYEDRLQTPYTEAVIHEVQRYANIAPIAVPHITNKDVTLRGQFIPKGTQVFPNIGYAMNSTKFFPEPEEFRPERFLQNGKFVASSAMLHFGYGKRRCLGESLARMELYDFFCGILHRFNVEAKQGQELSMKHHLGRILPLDYDARFVRRS